MSELLTVEGLKKSFHTNAGELNVLNGIDIFLNKGEMLGITGVSGVGKSTFLHIVGTLDKPTSGKVTYKVRKGDCPGFTDEVVEPGLSPSIKDIDPFTLSNGELADFRNRMVGFVFQFHYLLPEFTAIENVIMPGLIAAKRTAGPQAPVTDLKEMAEKLLDDLGLHARKNHRPGELSGGEQQRVAVARALFLGPRVVLADEPTGNLDTATGEDLFRLLMDINSKHGTAFVIVTHNESLSNRCHRILKMVDGKLLDAKNN